MKMMADDSIFLIRWTDKKVINGKCRYYDGRRKVAVVVNHAKIYLSLAWAKKIVASLPDLNLEVVEFNLVEKTTIK